MESSFIGKVLQICVSNKKGTVKTPVSSAVMIENYGIEGDAHAGNWHRQLSLLSIDSVNTMFEKGFQPKPGDFGENLIIEGIPRELLKVGAILRLGSQDVEAEVTQIGKACHNGCAIYKATGDCIMPREGIFLKILRGGYVKQGDSVSLIKISEKMTLEAGLIVVSDKASSGLREDRCIPEIKTYLNNRDIGVPYAEIIPDEFDIIQTTLKKFTGYDIGIIITSGGTGVSARDNTPDATLPLLEKRLNGFETAMMIHSLKITPHAAISRAVCGCASGKLIINLPGSPKAAIENLEAIVSALPHTVEKLKGSQADCAQI